MSQFATRLRSRDAHLTPVRVAAEDHVGAEFGERVEHATVGRMGHTECRRRGSDVGLEVLEEIRKGSSSSHPRCASLTPNASMRIPGSSSEPTVLFRFSPAELVREVAVERLGVERLAVDLDGDGPVKYSRGLRGVGAAWSFDPWTKTPGMPRSGSRAARSPRSPSWWPRLSPVLTIRSGSSSQRARPSSAACGAATAPCGRRRGAERAPARNLSAGCAPDALAS